MNVSALSLPCREEREEEGAGLLRVLYRTVRILRKFGAVHRAHGSNERSFLLKYWLGLIDLWFLQHSYI